MEQFLGGLQILLNWQNFLIIPVGLVIGIVVGAIPGLTSDLGIILCIPRRDGRFATHSSDLRHGPDHGDLDAVGHLLRRYLRRLDHGDPHQYARYIRQCGNTV